MTDDRKPFVKDLTKRELFAAMAVQGICSNSGWVGGAQYQARKVLNMEDEQVVAIDAVKIADALLAELEKKKK